MEDCQAETAPFLERLPLEIRNVIYRNLFSTEYTKRPCVARKWPFHAKLWPSHAYHFNPNILRTNRQVYSEAYTILYHENMFVRVSSNDESLGHLMKLKCIPTLLGGRQAKTFNHRAMSVNLDRQNTAVEINSQWHKPCYIITSDDIRLLCQSFLIRHIFRSDTYGHFKFTVTVHRISDDSLSHNPSPSSPQRRLLEPFTVLHSVPHFKIAGFASSKYCASIAARVSRMAPPVESCFDQVIELRDKCRENSDRKDFKGAVKVYKMAVSQFVDFYIPRTVHKHDWARLHPQQYQTAIDTRFTLLADLAFLLYRLEELEDAHFWAKRATYLGPSNRTLQCEMLYAKLVYLHAMASTRLGDHQQGADELRSGLRVVTKVVYEDDELVQWRMQAKTQIWGDGGKGTVTLFEAMGISYPAFDAHA